MTLSIKVYAQESPNSIQEEESAEVFLEEYTDKFQNVFFEALKHKGIQNYDRAINLLLECKQLQPENSAIDHELAKTYYLDKKYIPAEQYAIDALIAVPDNYWFLENLFNITTKQRVPFQTVKGAIPYTNAALRGNLAKLYVENGNYKEAKEVLANLDMTQESILLMQKINDAISNQNNAKINEAKEESRGTAVEGSPEDPLDIFRKELASLAQTNDIKTLERKAQEALEQYPLQPHFYFYYGLALARTKRHQEAIVIWEEGLDYLFDNDELMNDFYKELSEAYTAMGNGSKANLYLSKIKPGF